MSAWKSKLGASYPKAEVEKAHNATMQELKRLRKMPSNARCADCGAAENSWASVNLGCFLCIRCASVHRGLGTHITKCKNTLGSYLWGADELCLVTEWGNARVNATYLARYSGPGVSAASGDAEVRDFLQRKYGDRAWYARTPERTSEVAQDLRETTADLGPQLDLMDLEPAPSAPRAAVNAGKSTLRSAPWSLARLQSDLIDLDQSPAAPAQIAPRAARSLARPLNALEAAAAESLFGCFDPPPPQRERSPLLAGLA
jgi:hypothetical protein